MLQAAAETERVLEDSPPRFRILDFGDRGIKVQLRIWIKDVERGVNNVQTKVRFKIWKLFKEHNISFPYPQRDLHLKSPANLNVMLNNDEDNLPDKES